MDYVELVEAECGLRRVHVIEVGWLKNDGVVDRPNEDCTLSALGYFSQRLAGKSESYKDNFWHFTSLHLSRFKSFEQNSLKPRVRDDLVALVRANVSDFKSTNRMLKVLTDFKVDLTDEILEHQNYKSLERGGDDWPLNEYATMLGDPEGAARLAQILAALKPADFAAVLQNLRADLAADQPSLKPQIIRQLLQPYAQDQRLVPADGAEGSTIATHVGNVFKLLPVENFSVEPIWGYQPFIRKHCSQKIRARVDGLVDTELLAYKQVRDGFDDVRWKGEKRQCVVPVLGYIAQHSHHRGFHYQRRFWRWAHDIWPHYREYPEGSLKAQVADELAAAVHANVSYFKRRSSVSADMLFVLQHLKVDMRADIVRHVNYKVLKGWHRGWALNEYATLMGDPDGPARLAKLLAGFGPPRLSAVLGHFHYQLKNGQVTLPKPLIYTLVQPYLQDQRYTTEVSCSEGDGDEDDEQHFLIADDAQKVWVLVQPKSQAASKQPAKPAAPGSLRREAPAAILPGGVAF